MIHYQLRCSAAHEFDGWYRDSAAFEKLSKAGLVECPHCGSTEVGRALMAPAIAKGRAEPPPPPVPAAAKPETPPAPASGARMAAGPMPAQIMAMLQRMRAEVERNCDYVGPDFAEEARKMARGEAEARGIYGEATDAEAEALAEDGIDVARIPWVPRADG